MGYLSSGCSGPCLTRNFSVLISRRNVVEGGRGIQRQIIGVSSLFLSLSPSPTLTLCLSQHTHTHTHHHTILSHRHWGKLILIYSPFDLSAFLSPYCHNDWSYNSLRKTCALVELYNKYLSKDIHGFVLPGMCRLPVQYVKQLTTYRKSTWVTKHKGKVVHTKTALKKKNSIHCPNWRPFTLLVLRKCPKERFWTPSENFIRHQVWISSCCKSQQ